MRVILISQCSKNALTETRRILDQFAERKGDCVWETQITLLGLETLKKLLRSTARRNTAVACHLQRGRQSTELLWIIGNRRRFNREGTVPTNSTARDILRVDDEKGWHTATALSILTRLAALFHDFGKANDLFQKKLKSKKEKNFEPYRHEWISLFLFREFVGKAKSDLEWLERLSSISEVENYDFTDRKDVKNNLLKELPPLAKFIGWLIVSHHRLPMSSEKTDIDKIDRWMNHKEFDAKWNSDNLDKDWSDQELNEAIRFTKGTPFFSTTWRKQAQQAAKHALQHYPLLDRDWFQDRFTMHLARAVLMLSDHIYSSQDPSPSLQDPSYSAYANTDASKKPKQKLDEHNLGVARYAFSIAKHLPGFLDTLPAIASSQLFKRRSKNAQFLWQNKAYDLANSIRMQSESGGFFGVNLASTGCGKTLANARIMYALSDERKGCRFTIALGLRVLTLQTGDALRSRLGLSEDELAVLIGSSSFQELYNDSHGSESAEELLNEETSVVYGLDLQDEKMSKWFHKETKLKKLVVSPILVSTIDHLILATESSRGGKQIAPILRLLSSDLVLDEPDDFDISDMPALCRLVNFAGVFGAKVLLSSATLPPSIIQALFEAYASGRKAFNQVFFPHEKQKDIVCAWFDEYHVSTSSHSSEESFILSHKDFIDKRVVELEKQPPVRRGELVPVNAKSSEMRDVAKATAETILGSIYSLHDKHHLVHPETCKRVSIGLVRMANINAMVAVIKAFIDLEARSGSKIHFCVYHARFSMIVRSKIEEILDRVLKRHDPNQLWEHPEIMSSVASSDDPNHIFVVFGTPVTEVGRDHDYDWAVIEPSSMRSIIQLAGRVKRHRATPTDETNLHILQKNITALQNRSPAYCKPGFENDSFSLTDSNLSKALLPSQYSVINAIPRLCLRDENAPSFNLVDLEHARMERELLGNGNSFYAARWWRHSADWCYEIQIKSPFRKQNGEYNTYVELLDDESESAEMRLMTDEGKLLPLQKIFDKSSTNTIHHLPWFTIDVKEEIIRLAAIKGKSCHEISRRFAQVYLRGEVSWIQDPLLGFYREQCI